MKKNIAGLEVSLLFLTMLTPFAHAQSESWTKVIGLKGSEVAIRTMNGQTTYGKMVEVDENEITLQPVAKNALASQTVKFQKSDVKKVWTAKLKLKKGLSPGATTAIGAGVGAGVGLGLAIGVLTATNGSDNAGPFIGGVIAISTGIGAGLGYLAGRGGNRKLELIYQVK